MIEIRNLSVGYENTNVLQDINLKFHPGEITVLAGPNGCGKSTLLKSIVRIVPHSQGEILIDGVSNSQMSTKELAKKVAYLAQNKKAPDISVMKMVLHGRFAHLSYPRKYRQQDLEIAKEAIRWAGLEKESEKNVSKLSGGMQQKAYLAMALAQDADTILLDEPTSYLDVAHQLRLMDLAKNLAKAGKAVVLVLHDLTQALQIADQMIVLKNGRILSRGTPKSVYEDQSLEEAFEVKIEKLETARGETVWHYSRFS